MNLGMRALVGAALFAAAVSCNSSSMPGGAGGQCTLAPAASLSVVKVDPPSGATGVFAGASVSVSFNTCIDPQTVKAPNVLLAGATGFVSGSLSLNAATATVTFDPTANLAYSTVHTIAVSGLRGAHGETMPTPFGSSFTVQSGPEFVAPTTTASPPGGRYNAPQQVTLTCADNPGGTGCAATYYTADGSTPTTASTRYTGPITIADNATLRYFSVDVQGNAETSRQQIYVIDTVPPTLVASDPATGMTGVAVTKVVTATFSEDMKASTLTTGTVSVDHGVTFTLALVGSVLTITPSERLACNTTYQVAIGAGATDIAGNALVQPAAFSFTTVADCQEPMTTANVPGGVYTAAQSVSLSCTDTGGSGCARIVYTTDGSLPGVDPVNGTVVSGSTAGPIAIGAGDTVLRFFAEDGAGNREVVRQQSYTVTLATGLTFVATSDGIARGVGPTPTKFVPVRPGGRTHVFFRDPSNSRLYRGTDRGLLVSDGGEAWTFVPASVPAVLSVFAQGSKIFAGTSAGLLVSIDGGATFATRNLGGAGFVSSVIASGEQVYAATDQGIAVSSDRGQTFAMRTTANGLGSNSVRHLVLAASTLYAATAAGVSTSTDGGTTFVNRTTGLASASVNAIVVSGAMVYAATDLGLSISSNGGQTFTTTRTTANGLGDNYVGQVVFDGARLYVATGSPVSSGATNSFAVSSDSTGASFTPHAVSPSHTTLRTESIHVEGTTVRVGAYPAYYLSTDGGLTFVPKDLRGTAKKITGSGANLYALVEDGSGFGGVAVSTDSGQSFTIRAIEDGLASTTIFDVYVDGTNVYAATFGGLAVSTNGGTSFVNRTLAGPTPTSTPPEPECVFASGTTVWVGSGVDLQKSVGGAAFSIVQGSTGTGKGIAVSGTGFYFATSNGLWVSNSSGASGSFTLKGTAAGLGDTFLSDVAVDGSGKVLAATNTGLSVSSNAGASFTTVSVPAPPRGIFANGSTWYASTMLGLAISTDAGATWALRDGIAGVPTPAYDAWFSP